jgi:SAM-dependent methyltransferase
VNENDRDILVARYEERFEKYGVRPEALGWSRPELQKIRFATLSEPILACEQASVLDVGCGFADFYAFLKDRGWSGTYTGVDVVSALLRGARELHPDINLIEADFSDDHSKIESHDFVISSGIFNGRLHHEDHARYVEGMLHTMFGKARIAVCADFLSSWVNFQKPENWHADPCAIVAACRSLTRRMSLRHDYLPFEFALFLFRDDRVTESSTFPTP